MSSEFHFHVPESFHTKFGSDRLVSEKIQFEFLYVHNLVLVWTIFYVHIPTAYHNLTDGNTS